MSSEANRKNDLRLVAMEPAPVNERERARAAWSPEAREYYRSSLLPGITPVNLYDVRTFYRLLKEEVERAERQQLPLSVVAFHTPPLRDIQRRRGVELALRLGVRREDFPTRLTETTLAVTLPGPTAAAVALVDRMVPMLTEEAQNPVVAGVARYPSDGKTANALLRAAAWRSLAIGSPRKHDPDLERLLGPPPSAGR
jgi:hypothetical protein